MGKNLLNSDISSIRLHNMVNFSPLTAEISLAVCSTPAKLNRLHLLPSLLQWRRSSEAKQIFHDLWMSPELPPPPYHNRFMAFFPGPPRWAGARKELLDFIVQGKINRGRHTDYPAGCHSIWTNQCPPPPTCPIYYRPDALPVAQPTVAKDWANTLYIHFPEVCHVQNSPCVQLLHSPILAALLHSTPAVGVSQTLQRTVTNWYYRTFADCTSYIAWAAIRLGNLFSGCSLKSR